MAIPETIIFNGIEYRLMGTKRYYLSQSKSNEGRKGAKGLHTAIWEYYSGQKVPKGYVIHHKDGNCFNNDYSNLECISREEHIKHHLPKLMEYSRSKEAKEHLDKIRELTKEWHRSEEGKNWHREHSKAIIEQKMEIRKCEECGNKFKRANVKPIGKFGCVCKKCNNKLSQREYRKTDKYALWKQKQKSTSI